MKIHGAEGMLAENIRDEVARGGRLVIYTYCISVVFMTFKRASGIRLIRAGHSPMAGGLPFTFLSLLFGWWGIPWGPVYTVETIYRNLNGGIDVTNEVLQDLFPAASARAAPAPPTLHATPPGPGRTFNPKIALLMAGTAAALVGVGFASYCYVQTQNLTVLLVSGLDQPYTVTLNGTTHRLGAKSAAVLNLPEGDFLLQDAAGGAVVGAARTIHLGRPFFEYLGKKHIAIINPDRTAILLNTEVPYYSDGTTPPDNEAASYAILANQLSYDIVRPDYVLEQPPARISMPSGTTRLVKTRLEHITKGELTGFPEAIKGKLGYAAAREHLMIQARFRTDEALLSAAMQTLKPEDHRAFFLTRLADRPVLVNWHRYYQQSTEYTEPDTDLAKEYRGYLAAEPGNGALLYLLGRQTTDLAEAQRLWQQALAASPPCLYAHGAMGFDAMCEGRFADALTHYTAAEKAGVGSAASKQYRRQVYWALNQPAAILAEVGAERKADPLNLTLADEEIRATLALKKDLAAAQKLKDAYLAAYKATQPTAAQLADVDAYLQAGIAYQSGDLPTYATLLSRFDSPYHKFRVAFTRGELKPAAEAILAQPRPQAQEWLLLYLLAQRNGDGPAAEMHFQSALAAMKVGSHEFKRVAGLLAATEPDARAICAVRIDTDDKRVLLTALALRQPANQAVYLDLARKLNFNPEFPCRFLGPILAQSLKPG